MNISDIVVVDECQMIADPYRVDITGPGAVLGLRAEEIHLHGSRGRGILWFR